ncbi:MAG: hypothetical protein OXH78_05655 [Acidimicrobiaceae bacterium]|nr:hypothetical protein [Acidimicrobiaceae bacterium]
MTITAAPVSGPLGAELGGIDLTDLDDTSTAVLRTGSVGLCMLGKGL